MLGTFPSEHCVGRESIANSVSKFHLNGLAVNLPFRQSTVSRNFALLVRKLLVGAPVAQEAESHTFPRSLGPITRHDIGLES
jgi:hypothetical protein